MGLLERMATRMLGGSMFSIEVDEVRRCAGDLMLAADALESVRGSLSNVEVLDFMNSSVAGNVSSSIRRVEEAAALRRRDVSDLSHALAMVADSYATAEANAMSMVSGGGTDTSVLASGGRNLAKDSAIFDKKGGYGGDQGNMEAHQSGIKIAWWRFFENGDLFDAVRSYPGYENYTDDQIAELFKRINSEGCGYVAVVNSLFMQYESDPAKFERVFGFPMYDDKGEFNFNRFIIDFYCTTDNKFYLDEDNGTNAIVVDVLNSYKDHPEDFVRRYGVEPFADENHYNVAAMQAVANDYQNRSTAVFDSSGTTVYSLDNRLSHYLSEKGVSYTSDASISGMTTQEVRSALKQGKCVNIAAGSFNLYDKKGKVAQSDVGDHWMTVTGVTKDGNYVVSSWGKKYYIHPSEFTSSQTLVVDIT